MNESEKLLNKLIEDESFILWVYTNEDSEWSAWLADNQDKKDVVEHARRIILSMKFKSEAPSKERIDYIKNSIDDNIILMENQDSSGRTLWSPWIWRVAALLVVVSVVTAMFFILGNSITTTPEVATKYIEKSTLKGQKLTTYLPDRSKVTLNSNSKIAYRLPFNGRERNVVLKGEAFFEVEKDSLKPFIVVSDDISTTALGTSFNINSLSEERVEVSLVSGKVAVRNERKKIVVLNPGEIAIAKKSKTIEVDAFDYLERIGWKDGVLVFNNATFDEIFKKLEDWYGVTIHVVGGVNEDFHYTGKYDNHTLKEVLLGIAFVQYFDFSIDRDIVEINFKQID